MTLIASWNVNGIRALAKKGFFEYLQTNSPDLICLQEIKSFKEDIEILMAKLTDQYELYINSAVRPGYSGTAIFKKRNIKTINYQDKIGTNEYDHEGRFQLLETDHFFLLNGYFPNGRDDHSRVEFKLDFSFKVLDLALELKKSKPVIITGDLNTAHQEIDLKNPKTNKYTTGFLNIEREFLDQMVASGFIDSFRHFKPDQLDAYSWWSYRNNCRDKNVGWRLDYFFINQEAIKLVKNSEIRSDVFGSDHCPIHLTIDV